MQMWGPDSMLIDKRDGPAVLLPYQRAMLRQCQAITALSDLGVKV